MALLVWWIMRYRMKRIGAAAVAGPSTSQYGYPHQSMPHMSQPPPPQGAAPAYEWDPHNKHASTVSGGLPGARHELSNVPGTTDHGGVVYELHHGR